uniref:Alternative protein n=1 Tax=Macrostomum lignano TaxID=282301 RepID=A0A1I8GJC2_9PLAT
MDLSGPSHRLPRQLSNPNSLLGASSHWPQELGPCRADFSQLQAVCIRLSLRCLPRLQP